MQMGEAEKRLGEAIAALDSDGFARALGRWLEAVVRHDNLTILAYFRGRAPKSILRRAAHPAVHERFENVYLSGAYLLDPYHDLHMTRAPAGVYRLTDIAPDQFHRNPYFLDYYAATTLIDELAFVAYPAPGVSVQVCLGRDASSNRRFTQREIISARLVSPILEAFVERQWSGLAAEGEISDAAESAHLIDSLKAAEGISLSPRQAEVAMLILRGHSSVSIGLKLGISAQTVKVFRRQLYRKCAISSQAELFNLLLPLLGEGRAA
ncbi:helix-turn-helix transcriptional regulator [Rhodalgimonas zhirmunskyi]|uniref:Helix-turn-helix transcriptional regulator n=1 Tax=Rhodalgimonas zhirmunskyi TaxID=2964767 RepID=A0AAJ1UHA9_9RHOB|nr:helix-turn-helix transcriptional regulator [Rhodoalgimonas zhirmunskyi]MDQ2095912.1 helix-turn-helix transcriptional regulator [Rhodoalgimonas zhirmunskyi]